MKKLFKPLTPYETNKSNYTMVGFEYVRKDNTMKIWEVDLRSRKTGDSVETIYSGESHDEACEVLNKWYENHPELTFPGFGLEDFVDGTDGVFADIYLVDEDESHGVGKWN